MTTPLAIDAHIEEYPFGARLTMSQRTGSYDLVRLAFKERQVLGTEPFTIEVTFPGHAEPEELLPAGAQVVRCAADDAAQAVLARVPGATVLLLLHRDASLVAVSAANALHTAAVVEDIRSRIPVITPPDTVSVRTWFASGDQIQSHIRDLAAPRWADVARNYPGRVGAALSGLMGLRPSPHAGKLLLWHGPPGTGKTTAIRAVMREWAPWCEAHYVADPERFFASPGYIAEVIGDTKASAGRDGTVRWRLVIAEDCDEYLRASARRDAGAALGRLLNLADGVLGQGYNTLFVLTTNEDLRRLHPAVIRPGRCLAQVEFADFSPSEARSWLPASRPAPSQAVSLAQLYASLDATTSAIRPEPDEMHTGQYL